MDIAELEKRETAELVTDWVWPPPRERLSKFRRYLHAIGHVRPSWPRIDNTPTGWPAGEVFLVATYSAFEFITLDELRRKWRVKTFANAKDYESAETKIERFFFEILHRVDSVISAAADDTRKSSFAYRRLSSLYRDPLFRQYYTHDAGIIFDGNPSDFLVGVLTGPIIAGHNQFPIPRAWLEDLKPVWDEWLIADTRRKRKRPTTGRVRDEEGRFLSGMDEAGKFTSAHPKKFGRIDKK